jgi:beta-lactamase class A
MARLVPFLLILSMAGILARAQGARALRALERRAGGHLGVMAVDTGSGRTLSYRADERFAFCSTFKLLLVAECLKRVDDGVETLDRVLPYGPADLLDYAPVTREHLAEGGLTIGALCEAALTRSDNTAANLLLAALGGPEAFTRYARALGDEVTRLDRCEPALNSANPGEVLDTTSPRAMLATLRKELLGDALAPASRARLNTWLLGNTTGAHRLKAGLPATWRIGDKTGTGQHGATNDIGILYPPGRAPILVTAYFVGSRASLDRREAVLAGVGRVVAGTMAGRSSVLSPSRAKGTPAHGGATQKP